jgi:hypothetical protein
LYIATKEEWHGNVMLLTEAGRRDPEWALPLASGKTPFLCRGTLLIRQDRAYRLT